MSINTGNKNYIDETSKSYESNNKLIVADKRIYGVNWKEQTITDEFGRQISSISFPNLDSSNKTKSESLTTYSLISKAMGLDSLILVRIKKVIRKYLSPDEYEKIQTFFQQRLLTGSLNHLEPFDPSMLSDIKPGKVSIGSSLYQKIMGGVDEIIKIETQNEAPVHKKFKAAVINHPPEKPASINNEKRIDLTEEVNPLDQAVVERVSKKAKTILNDRQPSPSYQDAVLVNQSFSLEQAFQSIQEATTTSPIEAVQPFTACAVDDDLFYNIPEEQLFLSAVSVQTPPTNTQTSPAQLLLDDLLFPSPPDDDAFPLESTEEAFQSTQEATTTSPIEDDQPSAQKQTAFHIDDDLFYNIPEDELFLSAGSVQIPPTNTQTSPAQDDLFLTFSSDDDAFPLESTLDA